MREPRGVTRGSARPPSQEDPTLMEETRVNSLPKEHWRLKMFGAKRVAAGVHEVGGARYWTLFALSDLPNDLISTEDLKRFEIIPEGVQVPAVS